MGVERSVTRWYAKRQLLLDEIAHLEVHLAVAVTDEASKQEATSQQEANERVEQLERVRQQLLLLGPCPKSAMV